jgi:hypothetical protein
VPLADLRDHRLGLDCPCHPTLTVNTRDEALVAHQSWDAREGWERYFPEAPSARAH